jgi:hypothetical protein
MMSDETIIKVRWFVRSMMVELETFDFHHGFARVEASPGAYLPQARPS